MDLERFSGHLVQLDVQDGTIRRLHLLGHNGQRLIIEIDPPKEGLPEVRAGWTGPLALLGRDTRPEVRITEDFR